MKPTAEDALASIEDRLRGMVLRYFAPSMTRDDLLQEARIGAYRGWETWRPDGGRKLHTFMIFTAERLVQTTVLQARRRQNRGGDEIWLDSLDREVVEGETTLGELLEAGQTLEEIVVDREDLRRLLDRLREIKGGDGRTLTELEAAAVIGPAIGVSYADVGEAFAADVKAVDNARQRGLGKLHREPEAIGRPRPRPRPATFRRPRCLGSNLPTTEPEEDAMPETAANPIAEATQAQIDATVAWRDETVAKVDAIAGERLEALREILERAESLNGHGAVAEVEMRLEDRASGKIEKVREVAERPPKGSGATRKTTVKSKATSAGDGVGRAAAERRRAELAIREQVKEAGPDGLPAKEVGADLSKHVRGTILQHLVAEGVLRTTGSRRSLRYYHTGSREPESEGSQAA